MGEREVTPFMDAAATLSVRVIANARRTAVAGWRDGLLTIRLGAPAVEGKANRALREFLARTCGVRPGAVDILRGQTSRTKTLRIAGLDDTQLRDRLEQATA